MYTHIHTRTHVHTHVREKFLTILIARLPERFAFGENNSNNEILEGRDVEEAGVLIVLDVVLVLFRLIFKVHFNV